MEMFRRSGACKIGALIFGSSTLYATWKAVREAVQSPAQAKPFVLHQSPDKSRPQYFAASRNVTFLAPKG
jgi:hypothetical protein